VTPPLYSELFHQWILRLTGLEKDRYLESAARVKSWRIEHLHQELLEGPSVDNAVATSLLGEAVQELTVAGIPESKLLAKLRRDRNVWPTWAELRAAVLLSRTAVGSHFQMEVSDRGSSRPDYQILFPGEKPHCVEFKAIGLSDEETGFCRRVHPALDALVPSQGLLTFHAQLDLNQINLSSVDPRRLEIDASLATREIPGFPRGLGAVAIVGHGGQRNYARRVRLRLEQEAARQISASGLGWAAFYWTNGAPFAEVISRLDWNAIPERVVGLIFVGDAIAFPHGNIHSFTVFAPRGVNSGETEITSTIHSGLAQAVFERFQVSSGVRATLLVGSEDRDRIELLRRDGKRRILPFNLLMDRDPTPFLK
jgi:hypothetical protein